MKAVIPPSPKPDQEGHVPALAYIQVSIARDIVRERTALGLTQNELAKQTRAWQNQYKRVRFESLVDTSARNDCRCRLKSPTR